MRDIADKKCVIGAGLALAVGLVWAQSLPCTPRSNCRVFRRMPI